MRMYKHNDLGLCYEHPVRPDEASTARMPIPKTSRSSDRSSREIKARSGRV